MTLRINLLKRVDQIRGIAGVTGVDIRTSQVTVRTTTWSGGRRGLGTATNSDLVLPQRYKVRQLTQKEIASSGARYEEGDIEIGPITPSDGLGHGFTIAQLAPEETSDGIEIVYVLTGAIIGEYARVNLNSDRPFRYELILTRRRTTP